MLIQTEHMRLINVIHDFKWLAIQWGIASKDVGLAINQLVNSLNGQIENQKSILMVSGQLRTEANIENPDCTVWIAIAILLFCLFGCPLYYLCYLYYLSKKKSDHFSGLRGDGTLLKPWKWRRNSETNKAQKSETHHTDDRQPKHEWSDLKENVTHLN